MQKYWKKNINLFLMGQFLSGITSMVVQYAIIWYLTQETGSATILSFATLLGIFADGSIKSICWATDRSLG